SFCLDRVSPAPSKESFGSFFVSFPLFNFQGPMPQKQTCIFGSPSLYEEERLNIILTDLSRFVKRFCKAASDDFAIIAQTLYQSQPPFHYFFIPYSIP
ncbi:MAG TPA: hypothetical protein H9674_07895, partial [Firmicutes bacterium]|nr:hypothetical protein [Bacillota bacterium]